MTEVSDTGPSHLRKGCLVMGDYKLLMEVNNPKNRVVHTQNVRQVVANARLLEAATNLKISFGMVVYFTRRGHLNVSSKSGSAAYALAFRLDDAETSIMGDHCLMAPIAKGVAMYADVDHRAAFRDGPLYLRGPDASSEAIKMFSGLQILGGPTPQFLRTEHPDSVFKPRNQQPPLGAGFTRVLMKPEFDGIIFMMSANKMAPTALVPWAERVMVPKSLTPRPPAPPPRARRTRIGPPRLFGSETPLTLERATKPELPSSPEIRARVNLEVWRWATRLAGGLNLRGTTEERARARRIGSNLDSLRSALDALSTQPPRELTPMPPVGANVARILARSAHRLINERAYAEFFSSADRSPDEPIVPASRITRSMAAAQIGHVGARAFWSTYAMDWLLGGEKPAVATACADVETAVETWLG